MKILLALMALLTITVLLAAADSPSGVTYVYRDKAGQVEVHDKETDVIYVVDGTATFVTGGKMVGGKITKPGQLMGSDIIGGQAHHLSKGDVIVVPATTPHWFKEVPQ